MPTKIVLIKLNQRRKKKKKILNKKIPDFDVFLARRPKNCSSVNSTKT